MKRRKRKKDVNKMFLWKIHRRKNRLGFVSAQFVIVQVVPHESLSDSENDCVLSDVVSDDGYDA